MFSRGDVIPVIDGLRIADVNDEQLPCGVYRVSTVIRHSIVLGCRTDAPVLWLVKMDEIPRKYFDVWANVKIEFIG